MYNAGKLSGGKPIATVDYSLLDNPTVSQMSFYPRGDVTAPPQGARDLLVSVDEGHAVSCRFYPSGAEAPTILFFYGNGEVGADYDGLAPLYNQREINLFVADYRGYGRSGGSPSFCSMLSDSHKVLSAVRETLAQGHYGGRLYVMGRSMGRHSAFELAAGSSEGLSGVIIESGRATLGQFVQALEPAAASALEADYVNKIRSISCPVLVIHGERDTLAPLEEAVAMFQGFSSEEKRMVTIPGAGHNDLLYLGIDEYFSAIREFVAAAKAED